MPKSFIHYYWRTVIVLMVIFLLSTLSFSSTDSIKLVRFPHSDKVAHFLFYLGLGGVLYFDFQKDRLLRPRYDAMLWILFASGVVYGGVIELVQMYCTTTRSGEWLDWAADIVGLAVGMGIGQLFFRKKSDG